MSAIRSDEIISILKSEIENFDFDNGEKETGTVISLGDGIARVYGIDAAMYGEIVVFENGAKGMVQDIRANEIGVILLTKTVVSMKVLRFQELTKRPVSLLVITSLAEL